MKEPKFKLFEVVFCNYGMTKITIVTGIKWKKNKWLYKVEHDAAWIEESDLFISNLKSGRMEMIEALFRNGLINKDQILEVSKTGCLKPNN